MTCRRFRDQNLVQGESESIEILFVVPVDFRHQLVRVVLPDLHSCVALVHLVGAHTELLFLVLSPSGRNVLVVELQGLCELLELRADIAEMSHEVEPVVACSAPGGLDLEVLLQNVWIGKGGDEVLDELREGRHSARLHVCLQALHSVVLLQHLDLVEVGREQTRDRVTHQNGLQNEGTVVDRLDNSRLRRDAVRFREHCLDDIGVLPLDARHVVQSGKLRIVGKAVLSRPPVLPVLHSSEQKHHHRAAALGIEAHRELVPKQHPHALCSLRPPTLRTSHSLVHVDAADVHRGLVAAEVVGGVELVRAHPAVVAVDHESSLSRDLSGQGTEIPDRLPIDVQRSERTRPRQTLDVEIDAREDCPRSAIVCQLLGKFLPERLASRRQAHEDVVGSFESDVRPRGVELVDQRPQEFRVEIGIHLADHGQRIDRNDVQAGSVFRCGSLNHALDEVVEPSAIRWLLFARSGGCIDCLRQLDQTIGRIGRRLPDSPV